MDIRDLIPQDKFDFDRTHALKQLPIDAVRPIIPDLFEWLADTNWPISPEVQEILLPFGLELVPHIRHFIQTNASEERYFLLSGLVIQLPKEVLLVLKQDFMQLADHPSQMDKLCGVEEIAREILSTMVE